MKDLFHWLPDSLRKQAWATLAGKKIGKDAACGLLERFEKFGQTKISDHVGAIFYKINFPVVAKGPKWPVGNPKGVIDHYTASLKMAGTLSWFSAAHPEANVSSHIVIDRDGTMVILVDPCETVAWHARGFNSNHIGIEHVNAGFMKLYYKSYFYLDRLPYPKDRVELVQAAEGAFWEPYTSFQLASNIVIKRWLIEALPTLVREHFTDHHRVDPDRKRDCGPLWPLDEINTLVFSWRDGYQFSWAGKENLSLVDVQTFKTELYKET
jgi:N-acetyl-anhydromuramyl-L-alanine amidase AmpD